MPLIARWVGHIPAGRVSDVPTPANVAVSVCLYIVHIYIVDIYIVVTRYRLLYVIYIVYIYIM